MKRFLFAVTALLMLVAGPAPANDDNTPWLEMHTTYHFVLGTDFKQMAPFAERSTELWALTWEGTIEGDVDGVIRWWVPWNGTAFTSVGRWEIWDCEPVYPSSGCDFDDLAQLIMAGYDAFGYVSPTEWAGKGIVTYANEQYAEWFGRRITDGGWIDFSGVPWGEGPFIIYKRPANKL